MEKESDTRPVERVAWFIAIVAAWALWLIVRKRRRAGRWAAAGAIGLTLAFVVWIVVVNGVNREISETLASAPASLPDVWMRLRPRWEYGHAAGFALQLPSFAALVIPALV
jgi:predicted PurR-regulated permease PerM